MRVFLGVESSRESRSDSLWLTACPMPSRGFTQLRRARLRTGLLARFTWSASQNAHRAQPRRRPGTLSIPPPTPHRLRSSAGAWDAADLGRLWHGPNGHRAFEKARPVGTPFTGAVPDRGLPRVTWQRQRGRRPERQARQHPTHPTASARPIQHQLPHLSRAATAAENSASTGSAVCFSTNRPGSLPVCIPPGVMAGAGSRCSSFRAHGRIRETSGSWRPRARGPRRNFFSAKSENQAAGILVH